MLENERYLLLAESGSSIDRSFEENIRKSLFRVRNREINLREACRRFACQGSTVVFCCRDPRFGREKKRSKKGIRFDGVDSMFVRLFACLVSIYGTGDVFDRIFVRVVLFVLQ